MINISDKGKRAFLENNLKRYFFECSNYETTITITNENLIKESVKISEPLCTEYPIVFGTCEGSVLEFQYFGLESIEDMDIVATLKTYKDGEEYSVPMGHYKVVSCSKDYSTGAFKVKAYDRMRASVLDQEAHDNYYDQSNSILVMDLLKEIGVEKKYSFAVTNVPFESNYARQAGATKYTLQKNDGPFALGTNSESLAFTLEATVNVQSVELDPNKFYKLREYRGTSYQTEYKYFELFDSAVRLALTTSQYNSLMTKLFNAYPAGDYLGYSSWFGVNLTRKDGTVERYSTVAYEDIYGFSGAAEGSIDGLLDRTINGYKKIEFCIPLSISFMASSGFVRFTLQNGFTWTGDYDKTTHTLELTYPDGSPIRWITAGMNFWGLDEIEGLGLFDGMSLSNEVLADVTARDVLRSSFELNCQLGKVDRITNKIVPVEFSIGESYPSETLYPSNSLFPSSAGSADYMASKKYYSQLITGSPVRYSNVIINYRNKEGETQAYYANTGINYGETFEIKDNLFLMNGNYDRDDIESIAENIVGKLNAYNWATVELASMGLPWIEPGDKIEVVTSEGTLETYVLDRTIKGIMNLTDEIYNGEVD